MNPEILNELKSRIQNTSIEDDTDVTLYVQSASRLKALGDSSAYDKIPEIAARPEFKGRFEEILLQRIRQGIWDINAQLEEELGYSILECQDFYLYSKYAAGDNTLPESLIPWFKTWVNAANNVEIDEETRKVLKMYLWAYPIPQDLQLEVLAAQPQISE